jgi:multisubunit Na+/H+ antiporter MnhG subunit
LFEKSEAAMFYDARILMGMLFTLTGTILTAFGLSTRDNAAVYERSLGIDVNLWWGLVLLVFGVVVIALGRRGQARIERNKGLRD